MNAEDFMEAHANDFPVLANTYMMSDYVNEFHAAMEAYHRAKVEEVTDEEIAIQGEKDPNVLEYSFSRGAKWLRDKLLNQ